MQSKFCNFLLVTFLSVLAGCDSSPDENNIPDIVVTEKVDAFQLEISSFANGETIPGDYAFCVPAEDGSATFGENHNPHLKWSGAPAETQSYVLLVVDPDVPSVADDVNKAGKIVSDSLPRVDFYHWVLIDIPNKVNEIAEGTVSNSVTPGGKAIGPTEIGVRGINNYTQWFAGDEKMQGNYGGYDGPCPPWNDERLHHYNFELYALDVPSLNLTGTFDGAAVKKAMQGHVIAETVWVGTYSLNPNRK